MLMKLFSYSNDMNQIDPYLLLKVYQNREYVDDEIDKIMIKKQDSYFIQPYSVENDPGNVI